MNDNFAYINIMKWIESGLLKIIILALITKYWISRKFMVDNAVIKKFDKISYTSADSLRYIKFLKYKARDEKEKHSDMAYQIQGRQDGLKEYAIVNECYKIGFYVSDDLVIDNIKRDKRFQKDDKFDLELFSNLLKEMNLTEAEYKKLKLFELYRKQWEFFIKNSITLNVTKQDAEQYLRGKKQTRSGKYCSIDKKNIDIPEPSEEELRDFYKNNIHKYKIGDIHEFNILKISSKEFKKLSSKDQQILLDIMKDNNYDWIVSHYDCMKTKGNIKNIEPFSEEMHLSSAYQKKFLSDVIKLHGKLALNTGIVIPDKFDNIYYFYCHNIIKNSNDNFENIKDKVMLDYKNTKYIEYAKKMCENKDMQYKTLSKVGINSENVKSMVKRLYDTDVIDEMNYYEDKNFVYIVVLTSIENVSILDEQEIEEAYKELVDFLSGQAVIAAKQSIINRYDINS